MSTAGGRDASWKQLFVENSLPVYHQRSVGCRNTFERKSLWYNSTYDVEGILLFLVPVLHIQYHVYQIIVGPTVSVRRALIVLLVQ